MMALPTARLPRNSAALAGLAGRAGEDAVVWTAAEILAQRVSDPVAELGEHCAGDVESVWVTKNTPTPLEPV